MTELKIVSSGAVYKTTDYSMFRKMEGNREVAYNKGTKRGDMIFFRSLYMNNTRKGRTLCNR